MTCKKHGLSGKDGIRIVNETFTLSTQKDDIHTDGDLTIENGDINILESLEGKVMLHSHRKTTQMVTSYEAVQNN